MALSWLVMRCSYSSFHAWILLDELVAAESVLRFPSSFRTRFSTTVCVAMPAWSVPGIQTALSPEHAVPADQDVLQRVVHRMSQMQRGRHVWRRDDDAVRSTRIGRLGMEQVSPPTTPASPRVNRGRVIRLRRGDRPCWAVRSCCWGSELACVVVMIEHSSRTIVYHARRLARRDTARRKSEHGSIRKERCYRARRRRDNRRQHQFPVILVGLGSRSA